MIRGLQLRDSDRLLVAVPHPDDETLATGGLIQHALAAGAQLRVLVATDGDNNPWPQRWLEKRWRIDANARARWGARRRAEACAAMDLLGVPGSALRFFGWPDQGLTAMLMRDLSAEDQLGDEIDRFAPTVIAMPSLVDRHPDHNALSVLLELALFRRRRADCRRLGYVVHGPGSGPDGLSLPLDADQFAIKQRALLAHATQLSLSRRRMQHLGARTEQFEPGAAEWLGPGRDREARRVLPWPRHLRCLHAHELLLIVGSPAGIERKRMRLPRAAIGRTWTFQAGEDELTQVTVEIGRSEVCVSIQCRHKIQFAFAKVERMGPRLLIYDALGWENIAAPDRTGEVAAAQTLPVA